MGRKRSSIRYSESAKLQHSRRKERGEKNPGAAPNAERANRRALELSETFKEIIESGTSSYRGIARELDRRNIPTPKNGSHWNANTVKDYLQRLQHFAGENNPEL